MKNLFFAIFFMLVSTLLFAQDDYPYPSLSPKGTITQMVGFTEIEIEYERPSVRKRSIFGDLVPWNKVWRTGAGHCTKISFDQAVRVGGQDVPAGKYALFTIPNPNFWIVILNKDTTQYGSYGYNSADDIARFIVSSTSTDRFYETLNFDIDIIPNDAVVYLSWERTQIHFTIETGTDDYLEQYIEEELVSGKSNESNLYAGAAEYAYFRGGNLMQALQLIEQALEINPQNGWARDLRIKIYERLHLYEEALNEVKTYRKIVEEAKYEEESERVNELKTLEKHAKRITEKLNQ